MVGSILPGLQGHSQRSGAAHLGQVRTGGTLELPGEGWRREERQMSHGRSWVLKATQEGFFFLLCDGVAALACLKQGKQLKGMPLNESTNF